MLKEDDLDYFCQQIEAKRQNEFIVFATNETNKNAKIIHSLYANSELLASNFDVSYFSKL